MCPRVIYTMLLLLMMLQICKPAKKHISVVTDISDMKEFKKLLRTRSNILVLFITEQSPSRDVSQLFEEVAHAVRGHAILVLLDCSKSDTLKLCKRLKCPLEEPYSLKHYKDGNFHKDYDRRLTLESLVYFLRDPTGEMPWNEDETATDVVHLKSAEQVHKFLKIISMEHSKQLVMFYTPSCGYCKIMKPEYAAAAKDLKGLAMLAAVNMANPESIRLRQMYNITGFPTVLYFEGGEFRYVCEANKRKALVDFVLDPETHIQKKMAQEAEETWSADSSVLHLTLENFDSVLSKSEHALVVFYAPWCGYCKRIKPEFEKAAARVKSEKINGILGAVDATKEPELGARYGVKGYPTLKYFHKGEYKYDAGHARKEDQIIGFIKNPQEPPPPPPPEQPWSSEESSVRHLDSAIFRKSLQKAKHALVMFHAPWCGHCKSTKPEFVKAAQHFADELMVLFGAVDCTAEQELCQSYSVSGYPTFKYFSHLKKENERKYDGGRKMFDFVKFIHSQMEHQMLQQAAKTPSEAGFGGNVVLAFDTDFRDTINANTPTFVMFYASWCSHCSTVKPDFSKLATKMKTDNSPVKVIAIDAAENPKTADFAKIETLPTFKVYARGQQLAVYEGDRSYGDMLKFCKSFEKVNDEL